jgi:uncharacterized membrane protein
MERQRFWEIDALRGFAIINMVIFNYSFALSYLGIINLDLGISYAVAIASTFIFLSGVSMTLMKERTFKKFLKRGLGIFAWGALITLITFFAFPEAYIVFGILHFIGISIILGFFFLKYENINLVLGALLFVLGMYVQGFRVNFPWLLWLGLAPNGFYTFDYFPLLPWFGVTLVGIYFGNVYYKNGKRTFKIREMSNKFLVRSLTFLGRNSLKIYLLHQPLLIIVLLLLGFKLF